MEINILKLTFPSWEEIKSLPNDREYDLIVFGFDSIRIYGQIALFEDYCDSIFFDVMEHGYSNENTLGLVEKFTKTGYGRICKHAQKTYEKLLKELLADRSWIWKSEIRIK